MRRIIDDKGRIFGTINIIDALVVLFVLAILIAGIALVVSGGGDQPADPGNETTNPGNETEGPESRTVTVEMESIVSPEVYRVLDNISEAPAFGIEEVRDVRVERTLTVNNSNYQNYTRTRNLITLEVRLLTTYQNGLYNYRGTRIYIGKQLELDFGRTVVSGEIVAMQSNIKASPDE